MKKMYTDVAVIGGGPAGLAAAQGAYDSGIENIVVFERGDEAGGILRQCIHTGFGLRYFREELTGPEYSERFFNKVSKTTIKIFTSAMVLNLNQDNSFSVASRHEGFIRVYYKALIIATGCRERTRGAIQIPGDRPSGIFTAGQAQWFINMEGRRIGHNAVILGSGDIGLIMARRLTLEGLCVKGVFEINPWSTGLNRNVIQCLYDYDIPLYLKRTVINIHGQKRITGVTVCDVDENRLPVKGTEEKINCDTLLLSVGLIPENELLSEANIPLDAGTGGAVVNQRYQTIRENIFACGNALMVEDLVDSVTYHGLEAGRQAAFFINISQQGTEKEKRIFSGDLIHSLMPQRLTGKVNHLNISFRILRPVQKGILQLITADGKVFGKQKISNVYPGEMQSVNFKDIEIPHTTPSLTLSLMENYG